MTDDATGEFPAVLPATVPEVPADLWVRVLQHAVDPTAEAMPGLVPGDEAADVAADWDPAPVDDGHAAAVDLDVPDAQHDLHRDASTADGHGLEAHDGDQPLASPHHDGGPAWHDGGPAWHDGGPAWHDATWHDHDAPGDAW